MARVAIIGLDGAPFDVISSLAREGGLGSFRKLLEKGVSGVLRSTIPPVSPVAWPSISTGLNPGKHGVFGFVRRGRRLYSSMSIRGRAIWDLLALAGKRSLCVNVPFTYPPYRVRGAIISGPPCPEEKPPTYPPALAKEVEELGYRIDINLPGESFTGLGEKEFIEDCLSVTKARAEAVLNLAERIEWDLLYAVFTTLDRVQHVFFGRSLPGSPLYDQDGRRALLSYYRLLDEVVGKLLSELADDTFFIFVSDHGFEPLFRFVSLRDFVSDFLAGKGLRNPFYEAAIHLISRLGLMRLAGRLLDRLGLASSASRKAGGGFECGMGFIYSDRPAQELGELADFLSRVRDEKGHRIFERIYRREEVYWGPRLEEAPDLILVPRTGYEVRGMMPERFKDVEPVEGMIYKTGTHMGLMALRGFIAMIGPGVRGGARLDASVYDVAPTVLHLLGLPVLEEMDGEVLVGAFEEGSDPASRPVRKIRLGAREKVALRIRKLKRALQ
ncbi:hypothetical protein DRO32_00975 [Candidatus Bathyarchaeota archaeon]|nr:MAG: hypothetical protein DRO32_00975 [Candidatus Bathyarchaeota archaeon]